MNGFPDFIVGLIAMSVLALCFWGIAMVLVRFVLPRAVKKEEQRTDPCRTCDMRRARKRVCDGCPVKIRREWRHGKSRIGS